MTGRFAGEKTSLHRMAVISYHASPLAPPGSGDAGGMTVYVRRLAEELAARGLCTDIFTRSADDSPRIVTAAPGVRVISIEAGPRHHIEKEELVEHLDSFTEGVRAFATAQRVGYELVHSHYWQSGIAARSLAQTWSAPLVHSNHTLGKVKNRALPSGDVPEPLSRIAGEMEVMTASDVLIASTEEEWHQLSCLYGVPHDRLKILHPGVDHDLFAPGEGGGRRDRDRGRDRAELGLGDEAVVLYAGRIQPLKGLDLAVRAIDQIAPGLDREVVFLIAGGASGKGGVEEVRRLSSLATSLGIDDRVKFLGAQPHERLPVFYRAADVVVVCSHSESFGLAALEAHACGTPVVATAVGGLSHIVDDGHSGVLVSSREPSRFAAPLKTLLADPELWNYQSNNAIRSARHFSWHRTATSFLELYECLVREESSEVCTC